MYRATQPTAGYFTRPIKAVNEERKAGTFTSKPIPDYELPELENEKGREAEIQNLFYFTQYHLKSSRQQIREAEALRTGPRRIRWDDAGKYPGLKEAMGADADARLQFLDLQQHPLRVNVENEKQMVRYIERVLLRGQRAGLLPSGRITVAPCENNTQAAQPFIYTKQSLEWVPETIPSDTKDELAIRDKRWNELCNAIEARVRAKGRAFVAGEDVQPLGETHRDALRLMNVRESLDLVWASLAATAAKGEEKEKKTRDRVDSPSSLIAVDARVVHAEATPRKPKAAPAKDKDKDPSAKEKKGFRAPEWFEQPSDTILVQMSQYAHDFQHLTARCEVVTHPETKERAIHVWPFRFQMIYLLDPDVLQKEDKWKKLTQPPMDEKGQRVSRQVDRFGVQMPETEKETTENKERAKVVGGYPKPSAQERMLVRICNQLLRQAAGEFPEFGEAVPRGTLRRQPQPDDTSMDTTNTDTHYLPEHWNDHFIYILEHDQERMAKKPPSKSEAKYRNIIRIRNADDDVLWNDLLTATLDNLQQDVKNGVLPEDMVQERLITAQARLWGLRLFLEFRKHPKVLGSKPPGSKVVQPTLLGLRRKLKDEKKDPLASEARQVRQALDEGRLAVTTVAPHQRKGHAAALTVDPDQEWNRFLKVMEAWSTRDADKGKAVPELLKVVAEVQPWIALPWEQFVAKINAMREREGPGGVKRATSAKPEGNKAKRARTEGDDKEKKEKKEKKDKPKKEKKEKKEKTKGIPRKFPTLPSNLAALSMTKLTEKIAKFKTYRRRLWQSEQGPYYELLEQLNQLEEQLQPTDFKSSKSRQTYLKLFAELKDMEEKRRKEIEEEKEFRKEIEDLAKEAGTPGVYTAAQQAKLTEFEAAKEAYRKARKSKLASMNRISRTNYTGDLPAATAKKEQKAAEVDVAAIPEKMAKIREQLDDAYQQTSEAIANEMERALDKWRAFKDLPLQNKRIQKWTPQIQDTVDRLWKELDELSREKRDFWDARPAVPAAATAAAAGAADVSGKDEKKEKEEQEVIGPKKTLARKARDALYVLYQEKIQRLERTIEKAEKAEAKADAEEKEREAIESEDWFPKASVNILEEALRKARAKDKGALTEQEAERRLKLFKRYEEIAESLSDDENIEETAVGQAQAQIHEIEMHMELLQFDGDVDPLGAMWALELQIIRLRYEFYDYVDKIITASSIKDPIGTPDFESALEKHNPQEFQKYTEYTQRLHWLEDIKLELENGTQAKTAALKASLRPSQRRFIKANEQLQKQRRQEEEKREKALQKKSKKQLEKEANQKAVQPVSRKAPKAIKAATKRIDELVNEEADEGIESEDDEDDEYIPGEEEGDEEETEKEEDPDMLLLQEINTVLETETGDLETQLDIIDYRLKFEKGAIALLADEPSIKDLYIVAFDTIMKASNAQADAYARIREYIHSCMTELKWDTPKALNKLGGAQEKRNMKKLATYALSGLKSIQNALRIRYPEAFNWASMLVTEEDEQALEETKKPSAAAATKPLRAPAGASAGASASAAGAPVATVPARKAPKRAQLIALGKTTGLTGASEVLTTFVQYAQRAGNAGGLKTLEIVRLSAPDSYERQTQALSKPTLSHEIVSPEAVAPNPVDAKQPSVVLLAGPLPAPAKGYGLLGMATLQDPSSGSSGSSGSAGDVTYKVQYMVLFAPKDCVTLTDDTVVGLPRPNDGKPWTMERLLAQPHDSTASYLHRVPVGTFTALRNIVKAFQKADENALVKPAPVDKAEAKAKADLAQLAQEVDAEMEHEDENDGAAAPMEEVENDQEELGSDDSDDSDESDSESEDQEPRKNKKGKLAELVEEDEPLDEIVEKPKPRPRPEYQFTKEQQEANEDEDEDEDVQMD